jgi:hypothetical protein
VILAARYVSYFAYFSALVDILFCFVIISLLSSYIFAICAIYFWAIFAIF